MLFRSRHVIFFHRNEFRECADSPVSRPRVDFVAGLESMHSRSDPDHDPGHVMAQHEWQVIRQNALELAISDFGIQQVFLSTYNLKRAKANEGYLLVAAMLAEQVIVSVVTLNFDLALIDALVS